MIVRPVIQHNAYFTHAECMFLSTIYYSFYLLFSMLVDADVTLRTQACLRIKKARESDKSFQRIYTVSEVNFQGKTYAYMIFWITPYTDSLILSGYSLEARYLMSDER